MEARVNKTENMNTNKETTRYVWVVRNSSEAARLSDRLCPINILHSNLKTLKSFECSENFQIRLSKSQEFPIWCSAPSSLESRTPIAPVPLPSRANPLEFLPSRAQIRTDPHSTPFSQGVRPAAIDQPSKSNSSSFAAICPLNAPRAELDTDPLSPVNLRRVLKPNAVDPQSKSMSYHSLAEGAANVSPLDIPFMSKHPLPNKGKDTATRQPRHRKGCRGHLPSQLENLDDQEDDR
jgi:hypothetical protein